jgi:cytidylate kinase
LVTIDGPGGAGKTTVSRLLAKALSYTYVDTGALYRGVALAVLSERCPANEDSKLAQICRRLRLRLKNSSKGPRFYMNEVDITDEIRTPEVTMVASAVSARPVVREYLLGVQREMAGNGGVVFEGRDMGTVVFPGADVKFFLDADPHVRALRRHKELAAMGVNVSLDEVAATMRKRDKDDSTRVLAPLKPAHDAVIIDSTSLGVDDVVGLMVKHIPGSGK